MQSTTVRKAVRYRRVSGQSQKDNFSLTSQNNGMIKHCEHEGLLSDRMFTDIASGLSTRKRPQLLLMGQYSLDPANGITDMVFWDLDRFTRNVRRVFRLYQTPTGSRNYAAHSHRRREVRLPFRREMASEAHSRSGRIEADFKADQGGSEAGHYVGLLHGEAPLGLQNRP